MELAKKTDIVKMKQNEAIDLLTEKTEFDSLQLCDNLNLHYSNQLFFLKKDHFSGYRVTGICQEKIFFW